MKLSPKRFKTLLNIYPPYFGAGIKIEYISDDWRELTVSLKVRWYNRNYFGTHFGGSLYSMIDPHIALLLSQILGKGYVIWDKAADIDFIKATTERVSATIKIEEHFLEEIRRATADGNKYLPQMTIEIVDNNNTLIAKVDKTLYVRKKPSKN